MQIKKAVIGAGLGVTMGAMAFAGAGMAEASTGADGGAGAPGGVTVTKSTTVTKTNLLNGNRFANGNLSGNKLVVNLNVSVLNGPILSGNAVNSPGAFNSSTNITKTWQSFSNSFNTVTVTHNEVTTNNSNSNNSGGHGQDGGPGH